MFTRSGRSYGNATQTIANNPDDLDDLDRLDRVEFYRDDHVNFKAIIWKRSQTIGTTEGYPRSHRFFPVIENKFGPDGVEAENIIYKN